MNINMKKIVATATVAIFTFCNIGNAAKLKLPKLPDFPKPTISAGLQGTIGKLDATGKETFNSKTSLKSREMVMGYVSGFAEIHLGPIVRIGGSIVPYTLKSDTVNSIQKSYTAAQDGTGEAQRDQKVQVDLENLASAYVALHKGYFFIKGGVIQADLVTNELLGSGSKYGNADLKGEFFGLGLDRTLDDGRFARIELVQTSFDDIKLTSTGSDNVNVIDISALSGTNLSFSLGKTF